MSRPELTRNEMYEMMRRCWEENVETRPKFEELAAKFHDILNGKSEYAKQDIWLYCHFLPKSFNGQSVP